MEERSAAFMTLLPEHGSVRDEEDGLGDEMGGEHEVDSK